MPLAKEMVAPALDREGYADLGGDVGGGSAPSLPGEAGHAAYQADARRDHKRSVDLNESLKRDDE